MTPQELKNSILQLAIKGKLTEQLLEDGKVPKKFAVILSDDKVPFDIPENWVWTTLSKLVKSDDIGDGDWVLSKDMCDNSNNNLIQIGSIGNGVYIDKPFKHVSDEFFEKSNCSELYPNDILISRFISKNHMNVCTIPKLSGRLFTAVDVCWIRDNRERYNNIWLMWCLLSQDIQKQVLSYVAGTTRKRISKTNLLKVLIPIPPLAEQKRIVAKIEELLPLINQYEEAYNKLEELKKSFPLDLQKSILQMAIKGKLVPQDPDEGTGEELYIQIQKERTRLIKDGRLKKEKPISTIKEEEIPFEIPDTWKWVRLANVWQVLNGDRGKNYPAKSTLSRSGIPFISALNLDGKTVIEDDNLLCLSETQYNKLGNGKLLKGDIVVCIRGSLGKHGRYPFDKGAIASSLVIMRSGLSDELLDDYLMMYLNSPLFFSEIKKYDNGTAQPNLAAKSLEQFLFPLPPLAEQKRIVAKLGELLPLCEKLV